MSRKFLAAILAHREVEPLLSDEHFSVDGTLVKAWASMKSFQPGRKARHRTTAAGRKIRPLPAPTKPQTKPQTNSNPRPPR